MPVFTLADVRPSPTFPTPRALAAARGDVEPFPLPLPVSPPSCITVATNTKESTNHFCSSLTGTVETVTKSVEYLRKVELLIDWLRVTYPATPDNLERAIERFGAGLDWVEGKGRWFYAKSLTRGGVAIHYDGNEGKVTVDVTGLGCRQMEGEGLIEDAETLESEGLLGGWRGLFEDLVAEGVKFTRIDWAFDDRSGLLTVGRVGEHIRNGSVVSVPRTAKPHQTYELAGNGTPVEEGWSFGSRQSLLFVRMYNKRTEQLQKGQPDPGVWNRLEMQTTDEKASVMAELYAKYGVLVVAQDLAANISFRVPSASKHADSDGDTNRSRWQIAPWWNAFLKEAERVKIRCAPKLPTLEGVAATFRRQWASLLACMWSMPDMGKTFLRGVLKDGMSRWKPRHIDMMARHLAAANVSDPRDYISGLVADPDANAKHDFCRECDDPLVSDASKHNGYSPILNTCRACWLAKIRLPQSGTPNAAGA